MLPLPEPLPEPLALAFTDTPLTAEPTALCAALTDAEVADPLGNEAAGEPLPGKIDPACATDPALIDAALIDAALTVAVLPLPCGVTVLGAMALP